MRRISSVGSKNSFELSPIYTGHFREPSRASAEPLTIEGMNAFVLRLMMRMPRGARWGVETMDTTARMRGLHVRLVPEADVEAERDLSAWCIFRHEPFRRDTRSPRRGNIKRLDEK